MEQVDRRLRIVAWIMIGTIFIVCVSLLSCEWIYHDQLKTASHYWLSLSLLITWGFALAFHWVAYTSETFLEGGLTDRSGMQLLLGLTVVAVLCFCLTLYFEFLCFTGETPVYVTLASAVVATCYLIYDDRCIVYGKLKVGGRWREIYEDALRSDVAVCVAIVFVFMYIVIDGLNYPREEPELYVFTAGAVSALMIVNAGLFSFELLWRPNP